MINGQTALISLNEADVIAAQAQLASNAGIENWSPVAQAVGHDFYFCFGSPLSGYTPEGRENIPYETMMQNIVNVTEEPFDTDWLPPIPVG